MSPCFCTSWSNADQHADDDEYHQLSGGAKTQDSGGSGPGELFRPPSFLEGTWNSFVRRRNTAVSTAVDDEEEELRRKQEEEAQQRQEALMAFDNMLTKDGLRVMHCEGSKRFETVVKIMPDVETLEWESEKILWVFAGPSPHIELKKVDQVILESRMVSVKPKEERVKEHVFEAFSAEEAENLTEVLRARVAHIHAKELNDTQS